MKKITVIFAMIMTVAVSATPTTASVVSTFADLTLQEERIQIKPEELPDPVKQTISGDETLKEFPIAEAWQFKTAVGLTTFKVAFDNGSADKLWKTYDPEGNEIKE
ncbi:hypothetical protein GCM10009119_41150 [Algoriphagus jejuensis]|uniref:PepSY-like beta-lactamase-inhibitor n=1 Tax=Algoriphagus jejuensis TaxID=419934 RepID=A0ABP3YL74_9BACT